MKKQLTQNPVCYRLDRIGELKNSYFARVSQSSKRLFFEGDDECIVAMQNGVLTGNNRQNDITGGHRMNYTAKEMYSMVLKEYPDIMDIGTMCQALRISEKTGYKLIKSGQITALKVGRAYRIPKMHVLSYLKLTSAA